MPKYRLLTTSASLSTSNGSWIESEAQSGVFADAVTQLNLGTLRTVTFTPGRSFTLDRVLLYLLFVARLGSLTITVKRGTTTLSTDVYDLTSTTEFPYTAGPMVLALSTPVALSSGTAYTINVQNSISGIAYAAGTTTMFYAAFPDTATNATTDKPNNTVGMVIPTGVTLTMDESLTLGTDGTVSGAICVGGKLQCLAPTSSYALTVGGRVVVGANSELVIGASDARISAANRFKIVTSYNTANSAVFISCPTNYLTTVGTPGFKVSLWGEYPSSFWTDIDADALALQQTIAVSSDVSSAWSVGDRVKIVGYAATTIVATEHEIQSMTSTTITLTTTFPNQIYKGGRVVNISKGTSFGVAIENTSASRGHILWVGAGHLVACDGVFFKDIGPGGHSLGYSDLSINEEIKNCLLHVVKSTQHTSMLAFSSWDFMAGCKVSNFHFVTNSYVFSAMNALFNNASLIIESSTFSGCFSSLQGISRAGNKLVNVVIQEYTSNCLQLSANGHDFISCKFFGGPIGLAFVSSNFNIFTDCRIEASSTSNINVESSSFVWYGGMLGADSANTALTFRTAYRSINQCVIEGATIGSLAVASDAPGPGVNSYLTTLGGFTRFRNVNNTANNHKSWQRQGYLTADGEKLVMSIKSPSEPLEVVYKANTSALTAVRVGIFVNAQIASADFYSSSYTLPTLSIEYDLGTVVTDVASANTSVQQLGVAFTPTVAFAPVQITLLGATDIVDSSDITWDTLTIVARKYGYRFYSFVKLINEAVADIIAILDSPASNPFITESSASAVADYTGFTINHSTQVITVTTPHTVQELYDWVNYHLTLDENLNVPEFFTTIDGTTYNCSYDMVVDGVTLAGSGKRLYMPANDFSAINGGGAGCIVTDSSGTLVAITLQNIVPGSTWAVYKASDGSEIVSSTVAASSEVSANYTHLTDTAVIVRVRKASSYPKYLPWSAAGTITSSGLTVVVAQVEDSIA